jgi:hypothetical protein
MNGGRIKAAITQSHDIHIAALIKGDEKYVFLWRDDQRAEVIRTIGKFAATYDLSFTWYDAAMLAQAVRKTVGVQ